MNSSIWVRTSKMFLKRKLYNLLYPKIGEIWCLHRVLPVRSAFKSNRDLEISPDYLERIVQAKENRGFRFVNMDTFVAAANGKCRGRKLIHVTFDDGFSDVFTYAYPILKRYKIPFTLYVTTDMPDGKADLWWLQLEQMANGDGECFEKTLEEIYNRQEPVAAAMHAITSSTPDLELCRKFSMTWDQIREMMTEGLCTVGSHGVSHTAFTLVSEEQARDELSGSKRRLEEMLGVEVLHFSYPHSFYTDVTNQWVREAGYKTAVIGYGGVTRRKRGNSFFYRNFIVQP